MSISNQIRKELEAVFVNPNLSVKAMSAPAAWSFTFGDFFAGTGGFRHALERLGGKCVYSSERAPTAREFYKSVFGKYPENDDITKVDPRNIPDHDFLTGGFPCQTFSTAGVAKLISLGKAHGLDDKERGQLIFKVRDIVAFVRPKMFLLENVKGLVVHDKGNTLDTIVSLFEDLGYVVFLNVCSSAAFVPQNRERVFLIGFDARRWTEESIRRCWKVIPVPQIERLPILSDILDEKLDPKMEMELRFSDDEWEKLVANPKLRKDGGGYKFDLNTPLDVAKTKMRGSGVWHEIYVLDKPGRPPRRLSPRETARLFGWPEDRPVPGSPKEADELFGNAVVVPLVTHVAEAMLRAADGFEPNPNPQTSGPAVELYVPADDSVMGPDKMPKAFTEAESDKLVAAIAELPGKSTKNLAVAMRESGARTAKNVQKANWFSLRMIEDCILDGAVLAEAQRRLPRGRYMEWVAENCPFAPKAANYKKNIYTWLNAHKDGLGAALKELPEGVTVRYLREITTKKRKVVDWTRPEKGTKPESERLREQDRRAYRRHEDAVKRGVMDGIADRAEVEELVAWLSDNLARSAAQKAA